MNTVSTRSLRAATLAVLAGTWSLFAAAAPCTETSPQPEARESSFAVGGLFAQGGVDLTPTGRARVAAYASTLEAANIEIIVVRVPLASDTRTAEARHLLAQKRALALREQLAQLGVAEKRIYAEAAGPPTETKPVVIETIATWSAQAALSQTCRAL